MDAPFYKQKEESDQKKIPTVRKFDWDSRYDVNDFIINNLWRFYYLYLWQKWLTGDTDADYDARKDDMINYFENEKRDYTKRLMCCRYMYSLEEDHDFLDEPVSE